MKILSLLGFVLLAAQAPVAFGQGPTPAQPKPGREIGKLAYYLGSWRGEGEAKAGPFGAGGKLSSTTTCEWFDGGFHLVCRGEEHGPSGKRAFLNIRAHDEKTQAYTEYGISGLGETEYNTGGTIAGNKKTFAFDVNIDGNPTNSAMSKCRSRRRSSRTRLRRRRTLGPGRSSLRARLRRSDKPASVKPSSATRHPRDGADKNRATPCERFPCWVGFRCWHSA